MRYGIKTVPQHTTWGEMLDVWKAADEIELFESAWNWDHFYPLWGDFGGPNFEAWTMLAAMAQATTRIRIGCQVTGMIYRHPAVLANIAATVDVISNGRLILGVGAGWNEMETTAYGMPLYPLKERFDRFDEGVEAIIALLTQTRANYDGTYVQLTDAACEPKPIQTPHPPITIGGRGRTRTLKTAARYAQEWNVITDNVDDWRELNDVLNGHCATIGRDPSEITRSINTRMATIDDMPTCIEVAHKFGDAGVDLCIFNLPQPFRAADVEALANALS